MFFLSKCRVIHYCALITTIPAFPYTHKIKTVFYNSERTVDLLVLTGGK